MSRTAQQQHVIDTVKREDVSIVKVKAVAGAGKTFTLVEIAKELQPTTGLYLAYNKAIADEATQKFKGTNMQCSTIHSLAYNAVVRQQGLKVGFFGVRNVVPSTTPYTTKCEVVDTLEDFFLSEYTDINKYLNDVDVDTDIEQLCLDNLNKMANGEIHCGHSFYLKLYHIFITNGTIPVPDVDVLMADEFGDITGLTLDIFMKIKAKKKIAVGDPLQNIYSFNKTINAFYHLEGIGVSADLTESFRVSSPIAKDIENFVRAYMDTGFQFKGREYPKDAEIVTKGYIARNNSGLLEEMFRLKSELTRFHTTRKIDTILELPLILANLGNGRPVEGFKYKHIEKLRKEYEGSSLLQKRYPSVNRYVMKMNDDDIELKSAFSVVMNHGPRELNSLAKYARECAKLKCNLTLTTAHSSKGLEFSEVEIAPDLNESTNKAIYDLQLIRLENSARRDRRMNKIEEELRLYYVACSRAMLKLTNAICFPKIIT